jgi:hypothetical protein
MRHHVGLAHGSGLVGGAIIHPGESLNQAANEEGLSRSALVRTIVMRHLRERGEKA